MVLIFSSLEPTLAKDNSKNLTPSSNDLKVVFKKIKQGQTLISILEKHGFNNNQRAAIIRDKAFHENFTLIPGEEYRVSRDNKNRFLELKFYERPTDNALVLWRNDEKSGHLMRQENYKVKVRTASGEIHGSILASIKKHVEDDWVAQRFMDAYTLDFNLRKVLTAGDKFKVVYEEKFDGDHYIGCGEVLETELEVRGKVRTRRFVNFDEGGSFIANDWIHKNRPLYAPVNYLRITSQYNPRRLHPITRRRQPHLGVDFELPEGETIYTAYAGKVLRMGKNRAAGHYVVIRHPNGLESYYNHMKSVEKSLKPGAYVGNGQKIGTIGCTGYCTKPHLHFAVKKRGRFIDPVPKMKSYPFAKRKLIGRHLASAKQMEQGTKTQ